MFNLPTIINYRERYRTDSITHTPVEPANSQRTQYSEPEHAQSIVNPDSTTGRERRSKIQYLIPLS